MRTGERPPQKSPTIMRTSGRKAGEPRTIEKPGPEPGRGLGPHRLGRLQPGARTAPSAPAPGGGKASRDRSEERPNPGLVTENWKPKIIRVIPRQRPSKPVAHYFSKHSPEKNHRENKLQEVNADCPVAVTERFQYGDLVSLGATSRRRLCGEETPQPRKDRRHHAPFRAELRELVVEKTVRDLSARP